LRFVGNAPTVFPMAHSGMDREVSAGMALGANSNQSSFEQLALQRLMENRGILGPHLSWRVLEETEQMMRNSLEGQAIELGWIRDNACQLDVRDYLRMCLKKTSWYSFIYPMRVGALIAQGGQLDTDRFRRFGWYFGSRFLEMIASSEDSTMAANRRRASSACRRALMSRTIFEAPMTLPA
jgi:geranylgeranyl pyrophosphate synthase